MAIDDEIEVLQNLPVLGELEPEALRVLLLSTDTRDLRTGEILVRQGDRPDGGYFVLSGSFAIVREDSPDQEMGSVRAGGLIGEMALITATEAPVTTRAREPSVVIKVPRALFQRLLREYPGSAARLRAAIQKRLDSFLAELATYAARKGANSSEGSDQQTG